MVCADLDAVTIAVVDDESIYRECYASCHAKNIVTDGDRIARHTR